MVEYVPRSDQKAWQATRAEFYRAQGGRCAICQEPTEQPKLDHCHATGFIRGVLCNSCNIKLGWFEKRRRQIEGYLADAASHAAYVERQGARLDVSSESQLPARDTLTRV